MLDKNDDKSKEKKIPNHIGIIMDGNRRWARERNLPTFEGHMKGYEIMKKAPEWFFKRGVKYFSVFAFSTENWNRAQEEVNYLMKLLKLAIDEETGEAVKKNYRIVISGRIDELPGDLPESCQEVMSKTKDGKVGTLNICLNYGGRLDILDAIKKIIKNGIDVEQVHEGIVRKYLSNGELPDPDMIVRTSGEQRISGFLLWQAAYSEFFFMKKHWPEFEETDVDIILNEYNNRQRRFGGN
jgi:undecaprenyl diphosphate synthase